MVLRRIVAFLLVSFGITVLTFGQTDAKHTKWFIKVTSLSVDNCPSTGCACLLGGKPFYGVCHGVGVFEITEGKYGKVSIKGQKVGYVFDFKDMNAMDDMGYYIDKNATPEVKKALTELFSNAPFGIMGQGYQIKEANIKSTYKNGKTCTFSIDTLADCTLEPMFTLDGKSQMSIKNPYDPFGSKEVFLNHGKGYYRDYGRDLEFSDNSGEIEQFTLKSE